MKSPRQEASIVLGRMRLNVIYQDISKKNEKEGGLAALPS